jgi:uncharacterized protein YqgC (DUF456 family)
MTDTGNVVALVVALIIMLIGLAGIVLPVLPGTVLIFVGALIYAIVEGFASVGWPTLLVLGLLALVATGAELWTSSLGAKAGGASGWSLLAGLAGGLIGMIFFSLPGALVGAVVGVLLVELVRVRDWRRALKAGGGWAVGWLLSVVVQLVIGLAMVAIFVWQVMIGP